MKLYLIRHGSQLSQLCNDNTSLSEQGVLEIQKLGARLSSYSIDVIYSSQLKRAVQSAEIIKQQIYCNTGFLLEHHIKNALQEMDFGALTGLESASISTVYGEFMENRYTLSGDWAYPNGEFKSEVFARFFPVIQEAMQKYPNKNVVFVTHGWAIRSVLEMLFFHGQNVGIFLGKDFKRGSLTEIDYEEKTKRFFLQRFNDFAHLEPYFILKQSL